jgi:hypothetical protein
MLHSRFPSPTERATIAAAILAVAGLTACSDDSSCGTGGAAAAGAPSTVGTETVAFTAFTAGRNSDCQINGSGVVSVTVAGHQLNDTAPLTLCLPRPDLIETAPVTLTKDELPPPVTDRAQLIDAVAILAGGCVARLDATRAYAATATFAGMCDDGTNAAGFALTLAGQVPVTVTCAGNPTAAMATLAGTVAVAAAQ